MITVLLHIDEGKQLHVNSISSSATRFLRRLLNAIMLKQADIFTVGAANQARAAQHSSIIRWLRRCPWNEHGTYGRRRRVIFNITEGEAFLIGMIFVEAIRGLSRRLFAETAGCANTAVQSGNSVGRSTAAVRDRTVQPR
jgi:hypothetical protein